METPTCPYTTPYIQQGAGDCKEITASVHYSEILHFKLDAMTEDGFH
jgi:hypothetical protein